LGFLLVVVVIVLLLLLFVFLIFPAVRYCGHKKIKVLSVENPEQTNVLTLKPGVDQNIAF